MNVLLINLILHTAENGIIPHYPSNSDCMIYNMARGFVAQGHSVTILASEEFKPKEEENYPFQILYFPSLLPSILKPALLPWPKHLGRWLKKYGQNYDAVITSETFSLGTLIASFHIPHNKLLIWHEMDSLQAAFKKIPAKIWHKIIVPLKLQDIRVVARSADARNFISQYMHNVSNIIVDHGIDSEKFRPSNSPKKRRLVVVSQLVPRKRIDKTIRTFAELLSLPEYADFKLDIVGDGISRNELLSLSKELGVAEQVIFHGRLSHNDFAPISKDAMALLVNTEKDLNMVSIPESIVSGTPILTNNVPTSATFINNEGTGIAKDNWGVVELRQIIDNNERYVENCLRIRPQLLNTNCASTLLSLVPDIEDATNH
ncbi:MAG: glycosyltransferase [Prevotella sp.]|nr:glycosyltransferase [Bacteroides sp.]MCM1366084.1 glycosyltransferase [Prevotella sp.]MCM1436569.1 glycosyltransferase [Prevotella sp.]